MNMYFILKRENLTVVSGDGNLCLFWCLVIFNKYQDMKAVGEYSRGKWVKANGPSEGGVSAKQLDRFEAMFGDVIAMYTKQTV